MLDDVKTGHVAKADEHAAVPEHACIDDEALHVLAKDYKSWRNFYRGPKGKILK